MKTALADLERKVGVALTTDDRSAIDVLGYGEISTVLRLTVDGQSFACKRLPPFPEDAIDHYRTACTAYLIALGERGIRTASSTIELVPTGGDPVVYCVQPIEDRLLVDHLRIASPDDVDDIARRLVAVIAGAIDEGLGLDAQISNWSLDPDDGFVYLDVTTPLIRDNAGDEMLDTDLFLASLPAFLRPGVRRFLLPEILAHYYDVRAALLDLIGNLKKERLDDAIPAFLEQANLVVDPPISEKEISRYYRSDAVMWEVLQRLRRADRWWQRTIRHRSYPFLLPGKVDR
ncbi:MAG: DUF6206 family protein [Actinomycetota bacterium]|nr:DUF6206 family protein [Actinomycetota bacterium]